MALSFVFVTPNSPDRSLDLLPDGKVSVSSGEPRGWSWWQFVENGYEVHFHWNNDEKKASTSLFLRSPGTTCYTKVTESEKYWCFLAASCDQEPVNFSEETFKIISAGMVSWADGKEAAHTMKLTASHAVSVDGGKPHGKWGFKEVYQTSKGAIKAELGIEWNCKNNATKTKDDVFEQIVGTAVYKKKDAERAYLCYLAKVKEPESSGGEAA